MERERALVRSIELGAFPIHAMTVEPRRTVEAVTLIGPPPVDAGLQHRLVDRPVARDLTRWRPAIVRRPPAWQRIRGARIGHLAGQLPPFDDDVDDDAEVLVVERVQHLLR